MVMKNIVIVIGNGIKHNSIFLEYLTNRVQKRIGAIDSLAFISKNDDSIFDFLEDATKKYKNIVIAAEEGFELVGKILSTLTDDTLIVESNILLPAKREKFAKNSYLIKCTDAFVNVLKIEIGKTLGEILLEAKESKISLYLFGDDLESQRVEKFANIFEMGMSKTKLIDGLYHFELTAQNDNTIEHFLEQMQMHFEESVLFGDDLSSIIVNRLIETNKTITTAESCTGGLIASELTRHSGVSSIYHGSIVSYSNDIKHKLLNVKEETLERFGAVSRECVDEMLDGAVRSFNSDFAIAVSGIAGPTGGTLNKPVGTVIIGVKNRSNGTIIKKLNLKGDRRYIQQSAKYWALKLLVKSDKKLFFKFMSKSLDK
jgi:nicotinamide-nucleotide amidase